jgi:ABC-type transporter Mla subunit MlaD
MPWDELLKAILGGEGVPPALFLLIVLGLVFALVVLAKAFSKSEAARDAERDACANAANLIQEKRIEEGKAMLLALERTSAALAAHTAAVEGRTQVINDLVQGLAKVVQNQEAIRDQVKGGIDRLEKVHADILNVMRGK